MHLSLEPEEKKQLAQMAEKTERVRNAVREAGDCYDGDQSLKQLHGDLRHLTMELYRKNAEIKVRSRVHIRVPARSACATLGQHACPVTQRKAWQ